MSLYADEDISTSTSYLPSAPSGSSSSAHDPQQALAAALACVPETPAQADALILAGQRFEEQPQRLPELCALLLPMVADGGESLLRKWALEMVLLAVGRSQLAGEVKADVAQKSLDALVKLLNEGSVPTIKGVIHIFATIHAMLFRLLATSSAPPNVLAAFNAAKTRIVSLALDPAAKPQNIGVKASAWKFIQRILLAGTRTPAADPRLAKANPSDPNVGIITRESPLSAAGLEEEAILLRNQLVSQLFSQNDPALLHPLLNIIPLLCKSRPVLAPPLITSLASWTPAALEARGRPAIQIRAVEKTLRLVMAHLLRHPSLAMFSVQLNDALHRQKARLEVAWEAESRARRAKRDADAAARAAGLPPTALGKHPHPDEMEHGSHDAGVPVPAKRIRLEVPPGTGSGRGPEVDVSVFDLESVIESVMEGLRRASAELIGAAFENARRNLDMRSADAIPLLDPVLGQTRPAPQPIKEEGAMDPLDMDLDDDDDDLLGDDESEADEAITFADFALPPPAPLEVGERDEMVDEILKRIASVGLEMGTKVVATVESDGPRPAVQPREMWMLLLSRLATRSARGEEVDEGVIRRKGRERVAEFVTADFSARSKLAAVWLNEEWYAEKVHSGTTAAYTAHVLSILSTYLPRIDGKDKSLSPFLASIPEIPPGVVTMLRDLCLDAERAIVGFLALRDLVETRPPVRAAALRTLLDLCVHPDRKVRVLGISTVRRWVPGAAVGEEVLAFAREVLGRLSSAVEVKVKEVKEEVEVKAEDGVEIKEEAADAAEPEAEAEADVDVEMDTKPTLPTLSPSLPDPSLASIQQHVELPFALSRRHPDLLDTIFALYPQLPPFIQRAYADLLVPLIQSLGASEKLLAILRDYPEGADGLVLRVVGTLSGEGKGGVVRDLVRGWIERKGGEVDVRFVVPVLGELDKSEIEQQIPRIVSLLGTPDSRDIVRTAFASLIQKLTPADLLVALHNEHTALKPTMEAIGICFSMTTVFRSDVLVAAMVRIADRPTLPLVFMRTIIQAVTTYKSLVPFVANTVLPKLVAKKVWTLPQLWDGFVKLAKLIAPASYGVLLQLPKEWLKDVLARQPGLKPGLKTFLGAKQGARGVLVELFGEQA